jgi:hypothetical protein
VLRFSRFAAALWLLLIIHGASAQDQAAREVPPAWLNLVGAYKARISETLKGTVYRREDTQQEVNKRGEVKDSDTTFFLVERDLEGKRTMTEIDRFGNALEEKKVESDDDEDTTTMKVGPLEPFKGENREQYDFRLLEVGEAGKATIAYAPRDGDNFKGDGFQGEITMDTLTGAPLHIVGAPAPLPKRMKEMTMDLTFEPLIDSVYVPSRAVTRGLAGFLFFKFRFRVEQEFTDYRRVGTRVLDEEE